MVVVHNKMAVTGMRCLKGKKATARFVLENQRKPVTAILLWTTKTKSDHSNMKQTYSPDQLDASGQPDWY